jgi:hypothetical protein
VGAAARHAKAERRRLVRQGALIVVCWNVEKNEISEEGGIYGIFEIPHKYRRRPRRKDEGHESRER